MILFTGLKSNQCVSFHALTTVDNGNKFESVAVYYANKKGGLVNFLKNE